jgi:hypothetical protein
MESLRNDLRSLIAKYGLQSVHKEFQNEMRETYAFLRHLYDPPKNNLVIPVAEVIPDRIVTPHHKVMTLSDTIEEPPLLDLSSPIERMIVVEKQEAPSDPSLKEVVVQAKKDMFHEGQEKFSKAKHREVVLKKHKELTEKGIKPESLLTKENMATWLGQGMSYMRIAREHVGVPENEIAAMAKTFGLQSDIKKFIVMKKAGKQG